jgi:hypothetical protein
MVKKGNKIFQYVMAGDINHDSTSRNTSKLLFWTSLTIKKVMKSPTLLEG